MTERRLTKGTDLFPHGAQLVLSAPVELVEVFLLVKALENLDEREESNSCKTKQECAPRNLLSILCALSSKLTAQCVTRV